jgi:ABC-type multidrug transport system fused ATPase/permease subunit
VAEVTAAQPKAATLIVRSLSMLKAVRGPIVALLVLGVIASALPYVTVAVFGPMMQVVADAAMSGNLAGVWDLRGPLVARSDGLLAEVAGAVPFAVLLATWGASVLLAQLMYFVTALVGAKVERVLVTDIRQRVHDHLQTLSLDFFSKSHVGALMQRVMSESAGVQRLLTDCLLPPLIDVVVVAVAVAYLIAISWQMTVAALILTPLAMVMLRFAGRNVQLVMQRTLIADRAMGAELEQTVNGIAEIQMFNAQPLRSSRFHEVSDTAAKNSALSAVWMQATANVSQLFVAISSVVVLLVGIGFSSSFGLTFAGLLVFAGMVPTMFGAAQRVLGAYTT